MTRHALDRDERGFTLIETLAALLVFTIMTLGLVPLLLGSIRGSNVARAHTVGKNIAVQSMERIRGLPYYISYGTQAQRVDVLDFYYPSISAAGAFAGQSYAGGTYTTVCTSASSNPACPSSLPDDYSITYRMQFVLPNATGTYDVKTPDAGYSWDLSGGGSDLFKSQLLQVVVEAAWSVGPNNRSFSMTSLVGDRKFGDVRTKGIAGIDYGIKALTTFIDGSGDEVELTASAGGAESRIESKLVSTADQTIEAGRLRLIQTPTAVEPTAVDVDVADAFYSTDHAPPDSAVNDPDVGTVGVDLEGTTVARLRPTGDVGRSVSAASELATAQGGFSYTSAPGTTRIVYVDTQTDDPSSDDLHLDTSQRSLVVRPPALGLTLSGDTYAETRVAGSGVVTAADMSFQELNLLPTEFVSDTTNDRAVIAIDSFSANVTCDSTTDALSASASATYAATLRYWKDLNPADNLV
ncbi:MAG: prepilin-type N-terminal cleavage/methylation domain-containing protein, partial [Actinobacteria bacterium]|nr:prepilin-type N-terminal cleavage/methylation domain-containing protein [Actinomycetota bacterium]